MSVFNCIVNRNDGNCSQFYVTIHRSLMLAIELFQTAAIRTVAAQKTDKTD